MMVQVVKEGGREALHARASTFVLYSRALGLKCQCRTVGRDTPGDKYKRRSSERGDRRRELKCYYVMEA